MVLCLHRRKHQEWGISIYPHIPRFIFLLNHDSSMIVAWLALRGEDTQANRTVLPYLHEVVLQILITCPFGLSWDPWTTVKFASKMS